MNDYERRNHPLFSISIIMELTELTARQIRYYEEHNLVKPARTMGGHRLFSFSDIDCLLEIKNLLEKKVNLAGIKEIFLRREIDKQEMEQRLLQQIQLEQINYSDFRKKLRTDILQQKPGQTNFLIQGDLSRFFH